MPASYEPAAIFTLAPGAFFVLALLTALQNVFKAKSATNVPGAKVACGGNCSACMDGTCVENREEIARINGIKEAEAVAAKAEAARKAAEAKKAAEVKKAETVADKLEAVAEKFESKEKED